MNTNSGKRLTDVAFADIFVDMEVISAIGTEGKVVRTISREPHQDDNWICIDWNNGNQSNDEHFNFREVKVK